MFFPLFAMLQLSASIATGGNGRIRHGHHHRHAARRALNGSPGVVDDQIFGLAGNDTLNGADGDDLLDGGPGADQMNGGERNDTIVLEVGDSLSTGGNGIDTLRSSLNISLGTSDFENLVLIGAAISGGGSNFANEITGNELDNDLNGFGG